VPYQSEKQRRFIFAKAAEGVGWARKFIRDAGQTPPPIRHPSKTRKQRRRRLSDTRR